MTKDRIAHLYKRTIYTYTQYKAFFSSPTSSFI